MSRAHDVEPPRAERAAERSEQGVGAPAGFARWGRGTESLARLQAKPRARGVDEGAEGGGAHGALRVSCACGRTTDRLARGHELSIGRGEQLRIVAAEALHHELLRAAEPVPDAPWHSLARARDRRER